MKKLILVLLLLIALDLGSTYFVGKQSEKAYKQTIALLNDTPGIKARILSYESGFFHSKALSQIDVGNASYQFQDTIIHGPIAINYKNPLKTKLALGVVHSNIQTPSFSTPISADIVFPFLGGAYFTSESQGFQFKDQTLVAIEGKGIEAKGSVNRNFDTYTFQNMISNITMVNKAIGDKDTTTIKDMTYSIDYKQLKPGADLKVGYGIEYLVNPAQKIELSKFDIDAGFLQTANYFNTDIDAKLDTFIYRDETIGPCALKIKIENVDNAVIQLLKKLAQKQAVTAKEIQDVIKLVFKRGVLIEIETLDAKFKEGEFVLKGKMNIEAMELNEVITADNVLAHAKGDIDVILPKSVFQNLLKNNIVLKLSKDPAFQALTIEEKQSKMEASFNQTLDTLKTNQLVKEKDETVMIKFSFSKGKIFVDQKEIPISEIMG